MIDVEGVDYVRVPVTDIERAKEFYGTVLGLPPGPTQNEDWMEYAGVIDPAGNRILLDRRYVAHGAR